MQCAGVGHSTQKCAAASLAAFSPLISTAAIGIIAFLYCVTLVSFSGVSLKARDSALFALGTAALPLLTVVVQQCIKKWIKSEESRRQIEAINIWGAASALVGLALIAVFSRVLDLGSEGGTRAARILLFTTLATHVAALLLFALRPENSRLSLRLLAEPSITVTASIVFYAIAATILFKVDPTQPYFSPFLRNFLDPPFVGLIGTAVGFATAMVGAAWARPGTACL